MKILEMPPYYLPEQIASTHLTCDLTEKFVERGWIIENIVPTPCRGVSEETRKKYSKIRYEEMYSGNVQINRFPIWKEGRNPIGRALRYFIANIIQGIKGCRAKDVDVVIGGSTPPIQGLMCGFVAKRLSKKTGKKIPFIYFLQDVFPDSLVNAGMARKGDLLWKIGRIVENNIYNKADKIIVISNSIKRNIMEKGVPEEKIEVISNWIDLDSVHPVDRKDNTLISEFGLDPSKFIVVYAGNFGAVQGADIVLKAAKELEGNKDIQFVIFGGGPYFEAAKKEAEGLENVFIHELMPQDRISEVYSLGDVALITCKAGTGKAGMPSKTWSIMACNTPIIASFDTDSDLAEIIQITQGGKCVEPDNYNILANSILEEYSKDKRGNDLRTYVIKNASKDICTERYAHILESICPCSISVTER